MKINTTQNNPSFKSGFEFIANKRFLDLDTSKAVEVGNDLFGDCQKIIGGGKIFTTAIGTCTVYGLTDKVAQNVTLGHYNKAASEVTQFIRYFLPNGRAFAIGGNSRYGIREFFERDIEKFRDAKIKTTIFWGQNGGYSNVLFNADNDICLIGKNISPMNGNGINSVEDLRSAYDIINIAEGDDVFINGVRIAPELINKNNERFKW